MRKRFRAYREGPAQTALYSEESEKDARDKHLLNENAELLWEIEAETQEEASAIYHLRMGFEPYFPVGEWQPCPKCGAVFYPESYGECWRCGKIC